MDRPPYPKAAMAARAQGRGIIRISTNRFGRVDKVEIVEKIHPMLDAHTAAMARVYWTGPPNTTRDVPVIY
jgi:outer membrane biosynthesis protein TonB